MNAAIADLIARVQRKKVVAPGPCTEHTARCWDARAYDRELPDCCRAHLITLMAWAADALNATGAVWWADYGTLMGAVRNPLTAWADYPWLPQGRTTRGPAAGIVPHDKDGDLGVLIESFDAVRTELLEQRTGYLKVFQRLPSLKWQVSAQNATNVDLFFWHDRGDGTLGRRGYAHVDQFKGREIPKDLLFPLTTVEWAGLTLPAPRDPEAFLAFRYGPGWRTPISANNDGVRRP